MMCKLRKTPWEVLPLLLLAGCNCVENRPAGKEGNKGVHEAAYPAISQTELREKLKAGGITLIDANGTDSYAEGHIPGALDFQALAPSLTQELPEDLGAPMVVYCGGPLCSAWKGAAQALTAAGYTKVSHYSGGLKEWSESGLPMEKGLSAQALAIRTSGGPVPIPSCSLSPKAQAERIGTLRFGLFSKIQALEGGPGRLRIRFKDESKVVDELTEFIRFERECCTSLRFALEWAPVGGPVTLEVKGPTDLIAALEEVAASGRND